MLVGIVNRAAERPEEEQSLLDGEVVVATERVDRLSLHVVHHHVGQPLPGGPAVDQARNVRMVQAGEDLALPLKTVQQLRPIQIGSHYLDRDLLVKQLINTRGAHFLAAMAQQMRRILVDYARARNAQKGPGAQVRVELRFFGGLVEAEAAEVLGISVASVKRDWLFARAWLFDRLEMPMPPAP